MTKINVDPTWKGLKKIDRKSKRVAGVPCPSCKNSENIVVLRLQQFDNHNRRTIQCNGCLQRFFTVELISIK